MFSRIAGVKSNAAGRERTWPITFTMTARFWPDPAGATQVIVVSDTHFVSRHCVLPTLTEGVGSDMPKEDPKMVTVVAPTLPSRDRG